MIFSSRILPVSAMMAAVLLLLIQPVAVAETPQERVHMMSHQVMPFEMSKTVHVFEMTKTGGVQKVLVRDPGESGQVALVRRHLQHEAERFGRGDYSDPATLHGTEMPGLAELKAASAAVRVVYSELPAGAQLSFETEDLGLLTAIHRWFGAQLSEHGADARAE